MCQPRFGLDSPIATSSSGARYGKGRRSSARMQLKIVALTPIPSVRQRIAAMENAGLLASVRRAKRTSEIMGRWRGSADRTFARAQGLEPLADGRQIPCYRDLRPGSASAG